MFWVALNLWYPAGGDAGGTRSRGQVYFAAAVALLVFVTALSGGFVAGTRAGLAYNTFPTMAGQWIPDGLLAYEPGWRNFFENVTTIQFNHRVLATLVLGVILVFWWTSRHVSEPPRLRIGIHLLLLVACLQVALGISTLLLVVPTGLAVTHQGGALLLLTASLFVLHQMQVPDRTRAELQTVDAGMFRESRP